MFYETNITLMNFHAMNLNQRKFTNVNEEVTQTSRDEEQLFRKRNEFSLMC